MNQFNLGNFLNKFINNPPPNMNKGAPPANGINQPAVQGNSLQNTLAQNIAQNSLARANMQNSFNSSLLNSLKMNSLANAERSLYIKDLMNLPKDLEEVLVLIQNKTATSEEITKLLNTNINLTTLAELIKASGKEAMNKLVLVMSNAAKQGVTDLSQIKDAIKLINASVSVAGQENPNQTLKSFMLLYLPWLPLQEGVDFDLEIESYENSGEDSENSITILISTKNYGNVKVTLILPKGNSMEIFVNCSDKFPKEELLKRLNEESKNHSIQSNITFEQKEIKQEETSTRQAKISMSNLSEVNPFLLLMANAVIRHTIELDNIAG